MKYILILFLILLYVTTSRSDTEKRKKKTKDITKTGLLSVFGRVGTIQEPKSIISGRSLGPYELTIRRAIDGNYKFGWSQQLMSYRGLSNLTELLNSCKVDLAVGEAAYLNFEPDEQPYVKQLLSVEIKEPKQDVTDCLKNEVNTAIVRERNKPRMNNYIN